MLSHTGHTGHTGLPPITGFIKRITYNGNLTLTKRCYCNVMNGYYFQKYTFLYNLFTLQN